MNKAFQFFKESYIELTKKMTWLTWAQLQQYTIVILVFMVIFSLLVWVMDLGSSNVMRIVYSLFQ